jgi:putative SOS response-associated peptidase YedK
MCGRYGLHTPLPLVAEQLQAELALADPGPRYNAAPGQVLPVCRVDEAGRRQLAGLEWGLVPPWSEDPRASRARYSLINARAETLADKPAFRDALRGRRAVVPADGYYEWQASGGAKRPHWIRRRDGGLLALAGLWQRWQGELDGAPTTLDTFTIVVGPANASLAPIHPRMPMILDPAARERWLDPAVTDPAALRPLLGLAGDEELEAVPVGTGVNDPRRDDAGLIEPDDGAGRTRSLF